MIKAQDAIAAARSLLGTPYSEMDCIGLIKRVIRASPGGDPTYRCQGTNWLWRSIDNSAKYRDLTWRQEGIAGARAGMLAFKRSGSDVHHVGLVTGEGTVIHSSSAAGKVVETALDRSWNLLGIHRYIEVNPSVSSADTSPDEGRQEEPSILAPLDRGAGTVQAVTEGFKAVVTTKRDPLTLRNAPEGDKIGTLPRGAMVSVLVESEGWAYVSHGGVSGYCAAAYLTRCEPEEGAVHVALVFEDSAGNTWTPVGDFSAKLVAVND